MHEWLVLGLIGTPMVVAGIVFSLPSDRVRPWFYPLSTSVHLLLTYLAVTSTEPVRAFGAVLQLDPIGKLFLSARTNEEKIS